MPNHIITEVEIVGTKENIAKLIKDTKIRTDIEYHEDNFFDFNGIIPMPEELLKTASPTSIFDTQKEVDEENERYGRSFGQGSTKALLRSEADRRMKEYGALNWYDWSYNNWGTKWNAYEVRYIGHSDTKLVLKIETAWDTPRPIWEKLEAMGFTVNGVVYGEMEGTDEIGRGYEVFEVNTTIDVEYAGTLEDENESAS